MEKFDKMISESAEQAHYYCNKILEILETCLDFTGGYGERTGRDNMTPQYQAMSLPCLVRDRNSFGVTIDRPRLAWQIKSHFTAAQRLGTQVYN